MRIRNHEGREIRIRRVSEIETQIYDLEIELQQVLRKEEGLAISRKALISQPSNEGIDKELNELKIEVEATQDYKINTQDRLVASREALPIAQAEAKQAEANLVAKRKEIKEIRIEIEKMDSELMKLLQKPMTLIKSRKQAVWNLVKAGEQIYESTSILNLHPPKPEVVPGDPEVLSKLKELFPRQVARFRG